jgi:hypothetical protein
MVSSLMFCSSNASAAITGAACRFTYSGPVVLSARLRPCRTGIVGTVDLNDPLASKPTKRIDIAAYRHQRVGRSAHWTRPDDNNLLRHRFQTLLAGPFKALSERDAQTGRVTADQRVAQASHRHRHATNWAGLCHERERLERAVPSGRLSPYQGIAPCSRESQND